MVGTSLRRGMVPARVIGDIRAVVLAVIWVRQAQQGAPSPPIYPECQNATHPKLTLSNFLFCGV